MLPNLCFKWRFKRKKKKKTRSRIIKHVIKKVQVENVCRDIRVSNERSECNTLLSTDYRILYLQICYCVFIIEVVIRFM